MPDNSSEGQGLASPCSANRSGTWVASVTPLSVRAGQPSTLMRSAVPRRMTVLRRVVADSKDLIGSCLDRSVSVTLQQARTGQRRLPIGPRAVGVPPAAPVPHSPPIRYTLGTDNSDS